MYFKGVVINASMDSSGSDRELKYVLSNRLFKIADFAFSEIPGMEVMSDNPLKKPLVSRN